MGGERQARAGRLRGVPHAHALAGAAANIGSIASLLAGRPGSWEADYVRNMLTSTVGHDEAYLLEHRTEPLTVELFVDEILVDLGAWTTYEDAQREIAERYDAIGIPTASTPEGAALLAPATDEQERQADELADLEERLEQQRQRDWARLRQGAQGQRRGRRQPARRTARPRRRHGRPGDAYSDPTACDRVGTQRTVCWRYWQRVGDEVRIWTTYAGQSCVLIADLDRPADPARLRDHCRHGAARMSPQPTPSLALARGDERPERPGLDGSPDPASSPAGC